MSSDARRSWGPEMFAAASPTGAVTRSHAPDRTRSPRFLFGARASLIAALATGSFGCGSPASPADAGRADAQPPAVDSGVADGDDDGHERPVPNVGRCSATCL